MIWSVSQTFYDEIGGMDTIAQVVKVFYEGVAHDEVLKPMYPDDDMDGAEERLRLFLAQYWGGPTTYSDNRGHPRLRMRHVPYPVTPEARDRWLLHFKAGLDTVELSEEQYDQFWDYAVRVAEFMINTPG